MFNFSWEFLLQAVYIFPVILIALTFHEYAHAYVATKLGDPTPALTGRLSLNPLSHLDLIGTLCMIFFKIGWAKPVPINPRNFKNYRWGLMLVSIAGPMSNLLLAAVSYGIFRAILYFSPQFAAQRLGTIVFDVLFNFVYINILLAFFNFIPIPPLDGSKILTALLPNKAAAFVLRYEQYGSIILLLLLMTNTLDYLLWPAFLLISTLFRI